jgi:hypothetical protein
MTRLSQKTAEQSHVESFFRSLLGGNATDIVVESRDPPEPDTYVHCVRLAELVGEGVEGIYVEETKYHPTAQGYEPFRRVYLDSRWHDELFPQILAVRQATPALRSVSAEIHFNQGRLLERKNFLAVAKELGRAMETALPRIPLGRRVQLCFFAKEIIARIPAAFGNMMFLASEDFPLVAKTFSVIYLRFDPEWPWHVWTCPEMDAGWNAPSAGQFAERLEDKLQKAKKYDTQGQPLWLLIVAELMNDRESHVFPREEEGIQFLHDQVAGTGFDFALSPFQQVWLYSEFSGGTVRLYPVGQTAAGSDSAGERGP